MRMLSEIGKLVRHGVAVAAGSTAIHQTNGVDTQGYMGVLFVVAVGTVVAGAATSIKAQQSSVIDGTGDTFADIAGTSVTIADDDDDKLFYLDIRNPAERFVRCSVMRATQNATLDGIVAILYGADGEPVVHDVATVGGGERHVSPIAGTP